MCKGEKMTTKQKEFLNSAIYSTLAEQERFQKLGATVRALLKDMVKFYVYECEVEKSRFQDKLFFKKAFMLPVINEPIEVKIEADKRSFEAM